MWEIAAERRNNDHRMDDRFNNGRTISPFRTSQYVGLANHLLQENGDSMKCATLLPGNLVDAPGELRLIISVESKTSAYFGNMIKVCYLCSYSGSLRVIFDDEDSWDDRWDNGKWSMVI
jgi:hypothetical protein